MTDSDSQVSRGQNALQRRAQQLKRWQELSVTDTTDERPKARTRVQFSSATLFLSAVAQNDIPECARLLSECDINETTGDGLTALHQTAIDDNRQMVAFLLSNGAHVNCRDNEGWTPLHASASCGHVECVRLLLERDDCDVFAINCDAELARDVSDGEECVALIEARMRRELGVDDNDALDDALLFELRRKELAAIERDFAALVDAQDLSERAINAWIESSRDQTSGATVLHVCAAKGYHLLLESMLALFADKVDVDQWTDADGFTALHASAFWSQTVAFETLLRFGANFELKTRDARLISDLCHENPKIAELIAESKVKRTENTSSETQRRLNAKRQRESRRSTQGVAREDVELALRNSAKDETDECAPPMPASPPPMTTCATITLPLNDSNAKIVIHPSLPSLPRRRQKRRSTGIADVIEADVSAVVAHVAPPLDGTDDDDAAVDASTPITSSSRTSSRTSSEGVLTDEERVVDDKDYKKLYFEVLKENEFLIKKIKDFEITRNGFEREKRTLLRRIGELEEELKGREELLRDVSRLKDENCALIRVISKLSK